MTSTERATHTATPWRSSNDAVAWTAQQRSDFADVGAFIYDSAGCEVVVGGRQDEMGGAVGVLRNEDAAFIVRACNAHDQLTAALKEARSYIAESDGGALPSTQEFLAEIDAALRAALGDEGAAR